LAIRTIACASEPNNSLGKTRPSRQVVMVTTSDRLEIPPIAHFCELVRQESRSSLYSK
jgi:hypothetical protein